VLTTLPSIEKFVSFERKLLLTNCAMPVPKIFVQKSRGRWNSSGPG
jgi:hypothetical protein